MKLIVALIIAMALVVLGAQNTQSVSFHFLMFDAAAVPVVVVLLGAVLAGALLGWIISVPGRFRGARVRRDLERQVVVEQERTAAAVAQAHPPAPDATPDRLPADARR